MHLHRLEFAAIGPFSGAHTIDFDHLTTAGLFLLEGPTGSGKSTIIDAITFALFGRVAGEHASEDRLRSSHAVPSAETYVDLVFETASGVYRVRRSPTYERPKQKGSGTTTQQASVKLWRLGTPDAETGDLLSIRIDETAREIEKVLGLTRAQFVQTVVLPQGEFAAFLRAKPEDRTDLLQRVFGTEIYDLVQTELAERRRAAERAVTDQRALLVSEVDRLVGGLGQLGKEPNAAIVPDDALAVPGDLAPDAARLPAADELRALASAEDPASAGLPDFVEGLSARIDHDVAAAQADVTAAQAATDQARTVYEAASTTLAAIDRRTGLSDELASLDARGAEIGATRGRLENAQRAEPVRPLVDGVGEAQRDVADYAAALALARDALPGHLSPATASDVAAVHEAVQVLATRLEAAAETAAAVATRRSEAGSLADVVTGKRTELEAGETESAAVPGRRARLRALRDAEARHAGQADGLTVRLVRAQEVAAAARDADMLTVELSAADQSLSAAEDEVASAQVAHGGARTVRDSLPAERAALEAERAAQAEAAALDGELGVTLKEAKKVARAAREAAEFTKLLTEHAAEISARRLEAEDAVTAETAAHRARIAGMAGELAAELETGRACQVCGATEHPAPAVRVADDGQTAAGRVEAATRLRSEAAEALQAAVTGATAVEERLTAAHSASGGLTPEEAKARVADITARKRAATTAIARRDALAARVVALDQHIEQAQRDDDEAAARVAAAVEALQAARTETATLAERLSARREAAGSLGVEEAVAAVAAIEDALGAARAAGDARLQAEADLTALDEEEARLRGRVSTLREEIAALESRRAELRAAAAEDEARVAAALTAASDLLPGTDLDAAATPDVVERRVAEALALASALSSALDAERAHDGALTQLRARGEQLDTEIARRGYASAVDAAQALLDDAEREALGDMLRLYDQERHRVTTALDGPDLVDLPDSADINLEASRAALDEASGTLHVAGKRLTLAQERADAVGERAHSMLRELSALTEARAHAAPITRMALAAAGDRTANQLAITLTTFVLMRRFEEVVDAANSRLRIMSNGRFELERSDQREQRSGRRLGLALRVLDHHTETSRDPATLSGGETFYVSLCLALGLADVVTAEAGGVDLGTLFIDEGFGSLDRDTLDVVVTELARLRASGRTVGVVSHVDAMKAVIPERIQVRRADKGSTLEVVA